MMILSNYKHIHFIGIGGISMSSLAEILLNKGHIISGSDNVSSALTDHLSSIGINIVIGQVADNITPDIDLIVYTAAISELNPEFISALASGIPVIDRAELVGTMMQTYKHPISVAGTHGKTTTSSLLSEVFIATKSEPTISIGGILPSIGGNFKVGTDDYFILETCEYCDSFLKFNPHSAIILNIDLDHVDYFENLDQLYLSFHNFAKKIPRDGFLVINNDILDLNKVIDGLECEVITYGSESSKAKWYPSDINYDDRGCASFNINKDGEILTNVSLNVPGLHNVYNAVGVFALAVNYGLNINDIVIGLGAFTGTNRRFQFKGYVNDFKVIDDYAHHPTEIKATIDSAKANDINELWIAFQPHTYSRTLSFIDDFASTLSKADNIILLDIYASRETDKGLVHSRDLKDKIESSGKICYYFSTFAEAEEFLLSTCKAKDMLITMGAGDVFKLGENLVNRSLKK